MGLNLYVWHEAEPISADEAHEKLERWNAADTDAYAHHGDVVRFHEALLRRFPARRSGVWSSAPQLSDQVVVASCSWMRAAEVSEAVVELAAEHGLVCYEPASRILNPNAPGYVPEFVLTGMGVPTVPDPDAKRVDWVVRRLSDANFFAILDRADGGYAQIGYGPRAGLPSAIYALEYRDEKGHFRSETKEVDVAVRFLQGYLDADAWRRGHTWHPVEL